MTKQNAYFKTKALMSFLILLLMILSYHTTSAQPEEPMIRMAEIEIDSAYLEEYKVIFYRTFGNK